MKLGNKKRGNAYNSLSRFIAPPGLDPKAAQPPEDETKKEAGAVAPAIAPPGLEPGLS
jgi:hypothetical protein